MDLYSYQPTTCLWAMGKEYFHKVMRGDCQISFTNFEFCYHQKIDPLTFRVPHLYSK